MSDSIFARIGTIKGESLDDRHPDEIEVLSWSWGMSQATSISQGGGGRGAGRVSFQDFTFTHRIDRASPLLMRACATGEHLRDATITVRRAGEGQQDYLVITMNDLLVTSVSTSVGPDEPGAAEAVGLTFARVDLEYRPQRWDGSPDESIHFTHDLRANRDA